VGQGRIRSSPDHSWRSSPSDRVMFPASLGS
jgi:hypothetical protein